MRILLYINLNTHCINVLVLLSENWCYNTSTCWLYGSTLGGFGEIVESRFWSIFDQIRGFVNPCFSAKKMHWICDACLHKNKSLNNTVYSGGVGYGGGVVVVPLLRATDPHCISSSCLAPRSRNACDGHPPVPGLGWPAKRHECPT